MFDNKKLLTAVPVAVSAVAPVAVFAEGTTGSISDVTSGMTTIAPITGRATGII